MDTKETVLNVLQDLTGTDLSGDLDNNLFDSGLLDLSLIHI
mgnify:CR=1 FL=1